MANTSFRVIVAGSRTLAHQPTVDKAINEAFNKWLGEDQENWRDYYLPEIVSGGAIGVDFCGEQYAAKRHLVIVKFPADWNTYGKGAGFIRNKQMADYADALVAVWDGESRGTQHMIKTMEALGKLVFVYNTKQRQG